MGTARAPRQVPPPARRRRPAQSTVSWWSRTPSASTGCLSY